MSFSDKLTAHLTNAGRTVSQMTKNFSESSALQKEVSAEKQNIKDRFFEIGQLYYERFKDDPTADFYDLMESITNSSAHISELETQIQSVKERKPDLVEVPTSTKTVQPSAMVCMQCGSTYGTTQTFCSACGQKLVAQYPTAAAAAVAPAQTAADVQSKEPELAPSLTKPADIILPQQNHTPPSVPTAPDAPATPSEPSFQEVKTDTPVPRFCTNCGAPAASDSAFCAQCGNKLTN